MEEKDTWLKAATELLISKRYAELRAALCNAQAADIAAFLETLPHEACPLVYRLLPKEPAAAVFVEMNAESQKLLIDAFSDYELQQVLSELYFDDTVDLIEEMPAGVVRRILQSSSPDDRVIINELLQYETGSAGSIMTTEYIRLKTAMTVEDAFGLIRREGIDKETIYTCYVTSQDKKLLGTVSAKALMLSPLSAPIGDIMDEHCLFVNTHTDQEEIGLLFEKYDLLAIPVVDAEKRIVGIITVDDIMDVIHAETEKDFAVMAAISPTESDSTYLRMSVATLFKARIPWLLLLLLSATFTGIIISSFEASLSACVVLTTFIPMLMGTGGNCGSQSSVTVIRGLSLGEIRFSDTFRVLWKEVRVALLCAASLAAVAYVKMYFVDYLILHSIDNTEIWAVPATVCLTLAITVVCAKIIGGLLPIIAKRLGLDPAVMASPFITTIVDAVSLLVYFLVAVWLIPGI